MNYEYYTRKADATGWSSNDHCFGIVCANIGKAMIDGDKVIYLAEAIRGLFCMARSMNTHFSMMTPNTFQHDFEIHTFEENGVTFIRTILDKSYYTQKRIQFGLHYIEMWAKSLGILEEVEARL